jgi:hypothetical protein
MAPPSKYSHSQPRSTTRPSAACQSVPEVCGTRRSGSDPFPYGSKWVEAGPDIRTHLVASPPQALPIPSVVSEGSKPEESTATQ